MAQTGTKPFYLFPYGICYVVAGTWRIQLWVLFFQDVELETGKFLSLQRKARNERHLNALSSSGENAHNLQTLYSLKGSVETILKLVIQQRTSDIYSCINHCGPL